MIFIYFQQKRRSDMDKEFSMALSHNPYLPLWEHIPDGEPRVFGDRLYVFGSHDLENGHEFCEQDYVTWSTPCDDLSKWRYEGIIYRKDQDPDNTDHQPLYAPDVVQGPDGRYYLYYCVKFQDSIQVAVADRPTGPYAFLGSVCYPDGRRMQENQPYDPSVLVDKGHVYLYFGFAPCMINIPRYKNQDLKGCSVVELAQDMRTVLQGPSIVLPSQRYGAGTAFEGNEYFEGPSIRKIGQTYYLLYSSVNTHQLCYATSTDPMHGFTYRGCIVSNGDVGYHGRKEADKLMSVGNDHGGLVKVNGTWYMFYHRHTSLNQYNRQGCAEHVQILPDGSIPQVTITTSGLHDGLLPGKGIYPAVLCCNLTNGHMGALSSLGRTNKEVDFPYLASDASPSMNEPDTEAERYIANISNGTKIGYKYLRLADTRKIRMRFRGTGDGHFWIRTQMDNEETNAGKLEIKQADVWTDVAADTDFQESDQELYLVYEGTGKLDVLELQLF